MKNFANLNIRAIADDRGSVNLYVVVGAESESPVWLSVDRLKLLEDLGENVVTSFDSKTLEGEIKQKKLAMRKADVIMFAGGDQKVGELTIAELKLLNKMLTAQSATLREADETRRLEAMKIFG